MTEQLEQQFRQDYADYQLNRSAFRRLVRKAYLRHAASFCIGRTLDFGCGVGELLRILPFGSQGLDVNPYAVQYCKGSGLAAELYDPASDEYRLRDVIPGQFETLVISHVLEHLENPDQVLRTLFESCERVGIIRLLVVVPGAVGYAADQTHRTFITKDYLQAKGIFNIPDVRVAALNYFPINIRVIGNHFRHHEAKVVFHLRHHP